MKQHKRFHTKTVREKELRRLYREYRETWDRTKNPGQWVDVKEPYQKGWYRYFVVRDDVNRRRDAADYRRVLDKVNTVDTSDRQDFHAWNYKRRRYEPTIQSLRTLNPKQYEELNEKEKSFFVLRYKFHDYRGNLLQTPIKYYTIDCPQYFVYHIEPRMIIRHWLPDEAWETHCAEVRNKIHTNHLWPKIDRMLGNSRGRDDYDDRRQTLIGRLDHKLMQDDLRNVD